MTIKLSQLLSFFSFLCGLVTATGIVLPAAGFNPQFAWLILLGVFFYLLIAIVIHEERSLT